LYILVSAAFNPEIQERFRTIRERGMRCLWIVPHLAGQPAVLDPDLEDSGAGIKRGVASA
jgi:hypothetical protein